MNLTLGCFFSIFAMRSVGSGKGNMHRMRSCSGPEASPMIVDVSADGRVLMVWSMNFALRIQLTGVRKRRGLEGILKVGDDYLLLV